MDTAPQQSCMKRLDSPWNEVNLNILLHLFQKYQNLIWCLFLEVILICFFFVKNQRIRKNATENKRQQKTRNSQY